MNPQDPIEPDNSSPEELAPQTPADGPPAPPPTYFPPPAQPPSWPQQPFQQPPPWQPGYGYPVYPKQANGAAILILGIFSLASIFLCYGVGGFILGPISWIMGNNSLKNIDAGLADPTQRGTVSGGRICGIIGTFLGVLFLAGIIVFYVWLFYNSKTLPP